MASKKTRNAPFWEKKKRETKEILPREHLVKRVNLGDDKTYGQEKGRKAGLLGGTNRFLGGGGIDTYAKRTN